MGCFFSHLVGEFLVAKKIMGIPAASERSAEVCAKNMTKVRWIADRQHGAAGDWNLKISTGTNGGISAGLAEYCVNVFPQIGETSPLIDRFPIQTYIDRAFPASHVWLLQGIFFIQK